MHCALKTNIWKGLTAAAVAVALAFFAFVGAVATVPCVSYAAEDAVMVSIDSDEGLTVEEETTIEDEEVPMAASASLYAGSSRSTSFLGGVGVSIAAVIALLIAGAASMALSMRRRHHHQK